MAQNDELYLSLDGSVSKRWSTVGTFKVGATLIGGACLVLLATSVFVPKLQSTSAATPTNLIGMSTLSRPSAMNFMAPAFGRPTLSSLPGPSAWKELAVAAIEANNRCEVGGPKPTPRFSTAMANMRSEDIMMPRVFASRKASPAYQPDLDEQVGAFQPLGFWDPAGLAAEVSDGTLAYYREAELKHGRVCMLASLGFLVGERFHPLFGGDIDGPALQAATRVELQVFWPAVVALCGGVELVSGFGRFEKGETGDRVLKDDITPGDIGFDPLGLKKGFEDKGEYKEIQDKELAHARLAMVATLGAVLQELVFPDIKTLGQGSFS